ncbi:hypothetical protein OEA41_002286 [Lepraria neglecta]|uniref:RED-like N-terminal domain-containing protein n=1 Tax=Lepraria neglecta TaxID=209136 RepID=A0AAD9ZBS0_9LECA|nr:hypothetical protein OEA41_002286 [Lepraria neglecta]
MNNTQFRRLVLDTPAAAKSNDGTVGATPHRGGATPALGSRMRSSIPMTPRSVAGSSGNDFARQLAERNAELNPSNAKKFRSSAAPKGTKLRSGYQDRTQLRTSGEEDDKAVRVKALEEMVKLGQMDQATFEALRDEIVGGDVKDVHLVKGLDYKLLERVRRGEDVLSDKKSEPSESQDDDPKDEPEVDVDDEFEKLGDKEVQPMVKEQKAKKGEMAPPPLMAGKKRTRDDILRELKESRAAAAEKAKQSQLGPKFMKLGEKRERSRIERDEKGREVLITVDEDGRIKRKVRKSAVDDDTTNGHGLLMPDKDAKPLGMEVPTVAPAPLEDDDGDIFEGVGVDYNPLGNMEDDDDDSDDSDAEAGAAAKPPKPSPPPKPSESETSAMRPPPGKKRNYFGDSIEDDETTIGPPLNPLTDPAILAALKRASTINPVPSSSTNEEEAAKFARRKKMLESHDRDAEDMDMEFGSSRFGDQEDGEDGRVKLSAWHGEGNEDEDGGKGEGKAKRKRGAKKRKGDVNSAADVLKVMERRKGEGK